METINFNQFLLLVSWFAYAGLIAILALIARFYENLSGRATYYRWYPITIIALGASIARYSSLGLWGGDWLGDGLAAFSGLFLIIFCYFLYRQMTTKRK